MFNIYLFFADGALIWLAKHDSLFAFGLLKDPRCRAASVAAARIAPKFWVLLDGGAKRERGFIKFALPFVRNCDLIKSCACSESCRNNKSVFLQHGNIAWENAGEV